MLRLMNPNDLFALFVMLSICDVQSSLLVMVMPRYFACVVFLMFVREVCNLSVHSGFLALVICIT